MFRHVQHQPGEPLAKPFRDVHQRRVHTESIHRVIELVFVITTSDHPIVNTNNPATSHNTPPPDSDIDTGRDTATVQWHGSELNYRVLLCAGIYEVAPGFTAVFPGTKA